MMNMYKVEQTGGDHTAYLKEAMDRFSNTEPDIFIVSREGYKIYTQRSLLTLYSGSMSSLLSSVSCCVSTSISLPVNSNVINNLLRILYKGVATAYDEKDLALVNEAAELMGITLGDFNIRGKGSKNEEEKNDQGNNILSIEHVSKLPVSDNSLVQQHSDSDKLLSNNEDSTFLLTENLSEEISDRATIVKAEVLREVLLDDCEETFNVLEIEEQNEDNHTVHELQIFDDGVESISMTNVQTLVEEVERMGANIETLAEEVDRIDDDKDNDEVRVEEEVNVSNNETLELLYENVSPNDKRFVDSELKCDLCNNSFKRPQGLQRHKQKYHIDEHNSNSNVTNLENLSSDENKVAADSQEKDTEKGNFPIYVAKSNLKKHIEKHKKNKNIGKTVAVSADVKDSSKRKGTDSLRNAEPSPKITKKSSESSLLHGNPPVESASKTTPETLNLSTNHAETSIKITRSSTEPSLKPAKTPVTAVIAPVVRDSFLKKDSKLNSNTNKKYEKYDCKQCSKSFPTKDMFAVHEKKHLKQDKENVMGKFTCSKCEKCFEHKDNLESHLPCRDLKPVDNKETAFKCDICGKSFEKVDRLQLHRSYHTTFELPNGPTSSLPKITPKTGRKFVCDKCNKGFDIAEKLIKHKQKYHPIVKQEVMSPPSPSTKVITKVNLNPKDKLDKINQMLNSVVKKEKDAQCLFLCEKCSEPFSSMDMLETHRKTSHESHECNDCDKKFETGKELQKHANVHVKKTNIDKSLPANKTDSIHDQGKDDSSNYLCTLCDLEFVDENELFAHTSIHNVVGEEEKKMFFCYICDRDLNDENAFQKHNKAHTEKMLLTVKMPLIDITKNNVLCIKDID